jgi:co-chaperonin GroES (HSP10)
MGFQPDVTGAWSGSGLDDAHDVVLAHHEELFAVQLHLGAGVLAEQHGVADLDVEVGDRVLFGKYSGTEVKLDGEEFLVMREEDIMGVIEG